MGDLSENRTFLGVLLICGIMYVFSFLIGAAPSLPAMFDVDLGNGDVLEVLEVIVAIPVGLAKLFWAIFSFDFPGLPLLFRFFAGLTCFTVFALFLVDMGSKVGPIAVLVLVVLGLIGALIEWLD